MTTQDIDDVAASGNCRRDSFRSSAESGKISRETEPRAAPCEGDAGGMNCDLLRWAAAQKLPHTQHSVLVVLALHTDPDGRATITKAQIADQISLTERQVHTLLAKLAVVGLVKIGRGESKGRGRPANVYTVNSGSALHEAGFHNSISGSPIPEARFQNSDLRKPASRTQLQERAAAVIEAVDNGSLACIGTGGRAETPINLTTEDKIRSDHIPVSKARIDGLIARAGDACDPTAPSLLHGADLNRLLRAGCDWEADILPAVDKLAASFRRRGKRFSTWDLLREHALEFRDRRVAGLPPPAPVPFRAKRANGYGRQHVNGITPLAYTG